MNISNESWVTLIGLFLVLVKQFANGAKTDGLHIILNSRLDQLLAAARDSSFAKGVTHGQELAATAANEVAALLKERGKAAVAPRDPPRTDPPSD